jgi:hypothetical protein
VAEVDRDSVVYPSWWDLTENLVVTTVSDSVATVARSTAELLPQGLSFEYVTGGDAPQWALFPWTNIRRIESSIS